MSDERFPSIYAHAKCFVYTNAILSGKVALFIPHSLKYETTFSEWSSAVWTIWNVPICTHIHIQRSVHTVKCEMSKKKEKKNHQPAFILVHMHA